MSHLLDTHILLWAAAGSDRLTAAARRLIDDRANTLLFSAASLRDIAIKRGLGRKDFQVDAKSLRKGLLAYGYIALPVPGALATALASLPPIHRDPFDRLVLTQARLEGLEFVTADPLIARYDGPIRLI